MVNFSDLGIEITVAGSKNAKRKPCLTSARAIRNMANRLFYLNEVLAKRLVADSGRERRVCK